MYNFLCGSSFMDADQYGLPSCKVAYSFTYNFLCILSIILSKFQFEIHLVSDTTTTILQHFYPKDGGRGDECHSRTCSKSPLMYGVEGRFLAPIGPPHLIWLSYHVLFYDSNCVVALISPPMDALYGAMLGIQVISLPGL